MVTRLHRTISAGPDGTASWRDEVAGLAAGRIYRFTWITHAEVAVEASGVLLSEAGRRLRINVALDLPFSTRVLDHSALFSPNDTPMPDIKRIEFAVVSPGTEFTLQLTARLA